MKKVVLLCLAFYFAGCQKAMINDAVAEQQIIETLKKETKYFCERNLDKWQMQWAQQPYCAKMYAGKVEFENLVGWKAIDQFVAKHIAEHPEVISIPQTKFDYDIHLFGETAWVFYSKTVEDALVRETRFMVEDGGKWKIARMQTIY